MPGVWISGRRINNRRLRSRLEAPRARLVLECGYLKDAGLSDLWQDAPKITMAMKDLRTVGRRQNPVRARKPTRLESARDVRDDRKRNVAPLQRLDDLEDAKIPFREFMRASRS